MKNNKNNNYYFDELQERNQIIDFIYDVIKKGIIILQQQKITFLHLPKL